jgi:hypothetical protein
VAVQIDPKAPTPEWPDLELAFDFDPEMVVGFFDRQTGEIVEYMPNDDYAPEEQEATIERIDSEPGRYLKIERVPSREKFSWMEKFIETVGDPRLASRLAGALGGARPFRRFKDTLQGPELERWYAFERGLVRRYVVEWLETHGIAVGAAPPWPELAEPSEPSDEELRRMAHELLDRVPSSHLSRVAGLLKSLADGA